MVMAALERRIDALERKLNQTVRKCIVSSVEARGWVKVELPDSEGLVSKPLQVLFPRTLGDSDYDMPVKGEQVLCLFMPNGLEDGFVIGSYYSSVDKAPVGDVAKKHYRFSDGSVIEYDRKSHKLTVNVVGDVEVVAKENASVSAKNIEATASVTASVKAPEIVLQGNISSTGSDGNIGTETKNANTEHTGNYKLVGNLTVTGTISDGGGNSNHHDHE